jgi:hypothetical protein
MIGPLMRNSSYYKSFYEYASHTASLEAFIKSSPYPGEDQIRALKIADYLKKNSTPADRIYLWSGDIQIYYFTDRRPPVEFLWPTNIGLAASPEKILDPSTRFIVIGRPILAPALPDFIVDGLARDYEVVMELEDTTRIYQRKSPV